MHLEVYCWVFYESSCFCSLFSLSLIWVEQGEVLGLNCPGILIKLSRKGHPTRRRSSRINLRLMEEGTQTLLYLSHRLLVHNIKNPTQDILLQAALDWIAAVSVCTYIATFGGYAITAHRFLSWNSEVVSPWHCKEDWLGLSRGIRFSGFDIWPL